MTNDKPIFPKRLFWDVNLETLDYETHKQFIIERVFERGDVPDIRAVRKFYGDKEIIGSLKAAKWLNFDVFVFVKNLFNIKPTDFKCYMLNQSKGIPWKY
jgi:hypothetical protein